MREIRYKNLPASYGLTIIDRHHFGVLIEPHVWVEARDRLTRALAERLRPTCLAIDKKEFIPPGSTAWGYGPVVTETVGEDGWTWLSCKLPIQSQNNETAWNDGYAFSATLRLIFRVLSINEMLPGTHRQQLIAIDDLMAESGMHGASMSGFVSPIMTDWTRSNDERDVAPVRSLMCEVHNAVWAGSAAQIREFNVLFNQGTIVLSVPGDRCDLYCDGFHLPKDGQGYELDCHNVDSPFQQMELLMGLAAIHDLARADLWPAEPS